MKITDWLRSFTVIFVEIRHSPKRGPLDEVFPIETWGHFRRPCSMQFVAIYRLVEPQCPLRDDEFCQTRFARLKTR